MTRTMKPISLVRGSRYTNAYYVLCDSMRPDGVTPTRRGKGWTNFDVIRNLIRAGYIEAKPTGPRGGIRYHATESGAHAILALTADKQ